MSLDQTVSELRDEITQLRRMLFVAATGLLVGLMLWNLAAFWQPVLFGNVSQMEKIFEDMLGSREKLPEFTKLVLNYSRAAGGWMPTLMICSFTAVAWSLMSLNRRNSKFMLIAIIAALLLCAHRAIISFSMQIPLIQIIQGINEKV